MRTWRHQSSQQLDKVPEGRRPEHLLNTPRTLPNLQLHAIIYMELLHATDHFEIQQIINQFTVLDRHARAPAQVRTHSMKQ